MFIFVCMIVGAIIFGILFYKDEDEDSVLGVMLGALIGTISGVILTLIISTILFFIVPPVTTIETYELEQHVDTSSHVYYVNVDGSDYSFAYFDENKIINVDKVENVSFNFDGKNGQVEVQKKKLGGALDVLFFNFYKTEYDITIPSKEYIRYE